MGAIKAYEKAKKEIVDIHEEFISYSTKPLDSKHRITLGGKLAKSLGKRMKVEAYQIFVSRKGDILLRPAVSIPSNEAWLYRNPEIIGKIRSGLHEAQEGKVKRIDDLDLFLKNL